MRLLTTEFNKEYVKEAWYILPFLVYSDETNCGKTLWVGWLKWLIGIQFIQNWGWHWRYGDKGKPHRVGMWFLGEPRNHKLYIPFINQLWIK